MTGRTEQIEQITSRVRALSSADTRDSVNVLFVTGEAGIGKSTLLAAVVEECRQMAVPPAVALVECSTPLAGQQIGEMEALEPWARIVAELATEPQHQGLDARRLAGELAMAWVRCIPVVGDVLESVADTAGILKRHLPGMLPQGTQPPLSGATQVTNQQQMFQQYINLLGKLSERSPLVLMIDDFHWADSSSTNLLFAAARQLSGKPVLFVIAYRADDATSAHDGDGHPILHVRNELERYSLAAEVGIEPFDAGEIQTLLRGRYPKYGGSVEFERWLARISGGNALFVAQYLSTLEEDGYIERDTGTIREGFEQIRVPGSAYAVVRERLRRVDDESRELLRYASVEGDTFTAWVLGHVTETPQLKLLQRLRKIEQQHGIVRSLGKLRVNARETSAYQFAHALLHRVQYESLEQEERELIHQIVLDVLKEEWESADPDATNIASMAARLAVHAGILGKHLLAAEVLLRGAESSQERFASDETYRLVQEALDALDRHGDATGSSDNDADRLRARALYIRGNVDYYRQGRLDTSLDDFRQAITLFERAGDRHGTIDATNSAAKVLWRKDDPEAMNLAVSALERSEQTGYRKGRHQAGLTIASVYLYRGDLERARDWCYRNLDFATSTNDAYAEAAVLNNLGNIQVGLGEREAALATYQRSLAISSEIGYRTNQLNVLMNIGVVHAQLGDSHKALSFYRQGEDLSETIGEYRTRGTIADNMGLLKMEAGEFAEADAYFRRAREVSSSVGDRRGEAFVLNHLGKLRRATGDTTSAMEFFLGSLDIRQEIGDIHGVIASSLQLAQLQAQLGQVEQARGYLDRARSRASERGLDQNRADMLGTLGCIEIAEARLLSGGDRQATLVSAADNLRACLALYHAEKSVGMEVWEDMLTSVQEEIDKLEGGTARSI